MKTNIVRRALALGMAAVMLTAAVLCRHRQFDGDAAGGYADTAAYREKTHEKYEYPLTEKCHYDADGMPEWRDEYEYSPEGYLLSARHYSRVYGEGFDETLLRMDAETYRYDEAGRLLEEYSGYEYPSCDDDDEHYAKVTTTYRYDDKGRRTGSEQIYRTFVVRDIRKGLAEDNLMQESEEKAHSVCVITDHLPSGGWQSAETFYHSSGRGTAYSYTAITEYDAEGKMIFTIRNDPFCQKVESALYQYDDEGRPVSVFRQILRDGKEIFSSRVGVEYDRHSRVVRQFFGRDGDIGEILYAYDGRSRLTKRLERDNEWNFAETVTYTYFNDGTAVKKGLPSSAFARSKETRYSELDENGHYHVLLEYAHSQSGTEFEGRITREYGDKIPSGVKFGTAGVLAEKETLSPLDYYNSLFSTLDI